MLRVHRGGQWSIHLANIIYFLFETYLNIQTICDFFDKGMQLNSSTEKNFRLFLFRARMQTFLYNLIFAYLYCLPKKIFYDIRNVRSKYDLFVMYFHLGIWIQRKWADYIIRRCWQNQEMKHLECSLT